MAILTGAEVNSKNSKTGAMQQLWILRRDMDALKAVQCGADDAICGDCPNRGHNGKGRACYVSIFRAPLKVSRTYLAGRYGKGKVNPDLPVRIGAYGDPAALPYEVVDRIAEQAKSWTGYTHQWRTCDPRFRLLLMASTTGNNEALTAISEGWRTFIAVPLDAYPLRGPIICPASAHKTTCANCGMCNGGRRGPVAIQIRAHGIGAKNVREAVI